MKLSLLFCLICLAGLVGLSGCYDLSELSRCIAPGSCSTDGGVDGPVTTPCTGSATPLLVEDFSDMAVQTGWIDGSRHGAWVCVHNCASTGIELDGTNRFLSESTLVPATADDTEIARVETEGVYSDIDLRANIKTVRHIRTSSPNRWEVGALIWRANGPTFYYFLFKPNGWELGKGLSCPTCHYGFTRQILREDGSPQATIGTSYRWRVLHVGHTMTISIDDAEIVSYTDDNAPYESGRIGLFSEAATAEFDDLMVCPP